MRALQGVHRLREAEVEQHRASLGVEPDVLGLDVAVHEAALVQRGQTRGDLARDRAPQRLRQRAVVFEHLAQRASRDERHEQEGPALVLAAVQHVDDALAARDGGPGEGLELEAFRRGLVRLQLGVQVLDRHLEAGREVAVGPRQAALVDATGRARSELALDLERRLVARQAQNLASGGGGGKFLRPLRMLPAADGIVQGARHRGEWTPAFRGWEKEPVKISSYLALVAVLAPVWTACGASPKDVAQRMGGEQALTLLGDAPARAWLLDPEHDAARPHEPSPEAFPRVEGPAELAPGSELARALADPALYRFDDNAKACAPRYGLRAQFAEGAATLDVVVCFECAMLLVYRDGGYAGTLHFDPGVPRLARAALDAFPEHEGLRRFAQRP